MKSIEDIENLFAAGEAKTCQAAIHDHDGYHSGGDAILVIGGLAINLGTAYGSWEIAREIARRWNAAKDL